MMINRRHFLASALGARALAQPARRPNIIFILADDLGWGDLGCYGNRQIRTPNLDRMAAQGAQFTQFYVNNPVCSPSRTGFMSGHFPARHRIHGHLAAHEQNAARGMPNFLDPAAPFLPRLLHDGGYATGHFGKWHLGSGEGAPKPDAYGFDAHRTVNSNGPGWADESDPGFRARSTALIVDEAIRFIEQNRARPFFLNAWTLVPHATLNPTEEQMAPYRRLAPGKVPHKGAMQIFYSSVTDLDTQVGRLLGRLDELGLSDNTLVLFSSDNGPEDIHIVNASHSGVGSPGPFRGRKRSLYEGGVRVPFLARWPSRVKAGRVDTRSVLTGVDFLPSLTNLAGVTPPGGYRADGEDISDILTGPSRPRRQPLYWEWRFRIAGYNVNRSPMLAVRDGNWKLLLNPDRSRMELYDIPHDPAEMTNLAAHKPKITGRMAKMALDWQKQLPAGPRDPEAGRNDYPWPMDKAGA
jgi:N-acetylgalactosamine-6-sulfatase